jgi:hypothetical protein
MTVKDLNEMLLGVDENMQVLIPINKEFDGMFYSPCNIESGVNTVGTDNDLSEDDVQEMELLGKELPEENVFMFVPCGFFEEKDHSHELN